MSHQEDQFLTPGQVAKLLMVSTATIRIWAEKGEISALTTPGGHRRYLQSEVDRFAQERGLVNQSSVKNILSVLIVDDDIQFSRYLTKLLGKYSEKFNVDVANDGFNAGLKMRDFEPDIVLLDLMMPGIDGFEVCEKIKSSSETENVRVIAMTEYPSTENVEKILAAGAEVCLHKPVERSELLKLLELD